MSVCHSESITSELQQRDEVAEIKKLSQKDTNKVRLWRICLLVALSVTAVLVSRWTYNSLKDDETERFRVSVSEPSVPLFLSLTRPHSLRKSPRRWGRPRRSNR